MSDPLVAAGAGAAAGGALGGPWGAAIGGGLGLVGSFISSQSTREANETNKAMQERMNAQNNQMQYEFAKNGIQWKVEDARKAGIHPMYALGANTSTPSPSSIFSPAQSNTSIGDNLAGMGQDITRAALTSMSPEDRVFQNAMRVEQYKNAQLQNQLLESQVVGFNQANQIGPSIPSMAPNTGMVDQGDVAMKMAPRVKIQPSQMNASIPGNKSADAGYIRDYQFNRTKNGYTVVPSAQAKERMEDSIFQEIPWALRNQLMPNISENSITPPPNSWLPKGADYWKFDINTQAFRPWKSKSSSPLLPRQFREMQGYYLPMD